MKRVLASAPAKINLYLAVGPRRLDGYHDVTTVLQTLSLADEVTVQPSETLAVSCEPALVPAEENLAWRAAMAAGEAFGKPPAFSIDIVKRIPAGAGLGGGSSDAAAVLRAAALLWDEDPRDPRLARVAAALGADVPFFLTGGAAVLSGRGDVLMSEVTPLDSPVVLAAPPEPVPTGSAYAAFDQLPAREPPALEAIVDALSLRDKAAVSRNLYNNLEKASVTLVPEIAVVLDAMRGEPGVKAAMLAGSGSAVFGLTEDDASARDTAAALRERGWWTVATRTSECIRDRREEGA